MNSWTVIANSVEAAFGWSDADLQIIQMWIYVSYLLVMLPFTWLMDKKGVFLTINWIIIIIIDYYCFSNLSNIGL